MKSQGYASISRRKFLSKFGTVAAALCAPNVLRNRAAHAQSTDNQRRFVIREDRFGRMFPDLPPFAEANSKLSEALMEIGKPGGILDAQDELSAGGVRVDRGHKPQCEQPE